MERGGGRESVAVDAVAATDTVSQRRVAIEVAGLAVWGGAQRRTKLTDEQVPLSFDIGPESVSGVSGFGEATWGDTGTSALEGCGKGVLKTFCNKV